MREQALRDWLRRAAQAYARADLWLYATSGAYYLFFSLGPLAVLVLALLPWLPVTEPMLLDALGYAPGPFRELMAGLLADAYRGAPAALGFGLAAELWSAGKFLSLVLGAIGRIYDGRAGGGYLRRRLLGALYTAALLALMLGNMALLLFGERALSALGVTAQAGLWTVLLRGRGLLFFAAVTAVNALLFSHVPRRALSFRRQLPGAAFAAAVWLSFSRIYSWAVEHFRLFSVYGGLAIVILSLFWIYCSLYLLFLGAWLNALGEDRA